VLLEGFSVLCFRRVYSRGGGVVVVVNFGWPVEQRDHPYWGVGVIAKRVFCTCFNIIKNDRFDS
jgi:hypothetical protein